MRLAGLLCLSHRLFSYQTIPNCSWSNQSFIHGQRIFTLISSWCHAARGVLTASIIASIVHSPTWDAKGVECVGQLDLRYSFLQPTRGK